MEDHAIAIVGVGAILPEAPSAEAFWQNIVDGRYSITDVPPERWDAAVYFDADPEAPDKTYSKIGGWVRGFAFDWKRFRLPPKVANAMDEGQQWAVTIAADALADYGYPDRPLDTERTAVVIGTAMGGERHYLTRQRIVFPEYADALRAAGAFSRLPAETREAILGDWHAVIDARIPSITEDTMPGELPNIVSGRVANVLNLRGPNFITDAACASSFAALEASLELLTEGRVDAVLTGGVDRNMDISSFVKFCKIGALSATGTRPFGDGADGFVMGEGAAAFLLKRLADAERDGDRIYAVIRGVGGASDGKGKGITAPNPIGQQLALERAWRNAGLDPATATLIEAHGTSTRVGDVVEVESLARIFGSAPRGSIGLGSAKSNIGHLKAGAGAAGLLKAVLALHYKVLPPTLNAAPPNPHIDFAQTPFYLLHEARPWKRANGAPRRCGVSAYGFGGTNFHVVLEEHVPGALTRPATTAQVRSVQAPSDRSPTDRAQQAAPLQSAIHHPPSAIPFRGLLALGAADPAALTARLEAAIARVADGWTPPRALPDPADIRARERLVIDFADHQELQDRLQKARRALGSDTPAAWRALEAQGIYRGSGPPRGKIAFLFPGQGSQYVNMGRELAERSPVVAAVFAEADRVMAPILGRPLTDYIFVDGDDPAALMRAEFDLMQTAITQPAMLTLDVALLRLLETYGFRPDMVMGHSLGEYAALIAAGIMPFAHALEAAAARGQEMSSVRVDDNGKMAYVLAPLAEVEATLAQIDGYVVPANINSHSQCVFGGASAAVEAAVARFTEQGYQAATIPVSHAFHTRIVAPASAPLRQVLDRLDIRRPDLPIVTNVTGGFYPTDDVEALKEILQQQIASPVQWVQGLRTLYDAGVRVFVEVGPKRALRGFVKDVFADHDDVLALLTNHPKTGALAAFNQALCGLYAAGHGLPAVRTTPATEPGEPTMKPSPLSPAPADDGAVPAALEGLTRLLSQALQGAPAAAQARPFDRNEPPLGSIVISGTGLGLPGAEKTVMDPDNALRILRGEQFVDLIPERFRKMMVNKRIVRVVKSEDGGGSFATIDDTSEVIKLAGRPGAFDLTAEYGVPDKLVEALDITSQLAIAAGLDALREAGIPLTLSYRRTTTGKYLPDRWLLPPALRDETGIIFASAFPGGDRFADEMKRYYTYENRQRLLETLEDLRQVTTDPATLDELNRRLGQVRAELEREPYLFDRRFLFRILSMGHSQFAQYIGARGPNTQLNAACASTAQAVAMAEDWIRDGRCRRVVVIAADDVTSDTMMEWVGAGFLSVGAATTEDRVDQAALPFDRRRHGTIMGMGACALVVESQDAVAERGMRGIVELLSSESSNSAFHGTRLDVEHISLIMNQLVSAAERRFGLDRRAMAPQTVFMSHETFTPARGGSASAEVMALRHTFGEAANELIVANTKGFTGHPMGVGVEDVIAVKILEHGIVPPVPNFKEVDPELGPLNLSRGGRYPVRYALHLAAGFGSQIAMTLTRRIPGALDRVDSPGQYAHWLAAVSGYDRPETEVVQRVLRIQADGTPTRLPAASRWKPGTGPTQRSAEFGTRGVERSIADFGLRISDSPTPARSSVGAQPAAPAQPIADSPADVAAQPAAPATADSPLPQSAFRDPQSAIQDQVLAIVADKTGYPVDMLELDLSLEADLGIDTVKQAETFAALRDTFALPREDDLRISDYPTLEHVIAFVRERVGATDGRPIADSPADVGAQPAAPATADSPVPQPAFRDPQSTIQDQVLAIVADKTGYPVDMLELDLDLEADLGIDTVKQAETFAALRDTFALPREDDLRISDYPTLEHVIAFVRERVGATDGRPIADSPADVAAQPAAPATADSPVPQPAFRDPQSTIQDQVLAIVADKTGYPIDMLELDLDLEADLGIDTVKQAETFAALRDTFALPREDDLRISDYPTLEHVIAFVRERVTTVDTPSVTDAAVGAPQRAQQAAPLHPAPAPPEAESTIPRRLPVPTLRPGLDVCKPTGIVLDASSRVVVAPDEGGVGRSLVLRLERLGVTVLSLDPSLAEADVAAQIDAWLAEGPVHGVYWLPALDAEPDLPDLDLPAWRELNRRRVKNLYTAMRALYDAVAGAGRFLIAGTRLGGLHGYGPKPATAPLGGAVTGFAKAYRVEQDLRESGRGLLVKAVDFAVSRKTAAPADALIAETLADPGVVEVGYHQDRRYGVTLREELLPDGEAGLALGPGTVFLVTGAAGGITSAIVADLAAASRGTFHLLDLVDAPPPDDPDVSLFRRDPEALKQKLIDAARAAGERPTPATINRQIAAVERREAALRAVEAVQTAGGTAVYHAVDLLDPDALGAVMAEVREHHGRLDALLHAGGVLVDRTLPDKTPEQFNLVFDVKVDGLFSLLRAAGDLPIGAIVSFSSVAGRFGNNGQSDYSAANDLLCKLTSSVRRWRPETRALAIDWTAWGEIGMAARGSVPQVMEALGIDMLPPAAGIPVVRRELEAGTVGELVVAGRLGAWLEEADPTGGLDPAALQASLAGRAQPLIGRVTAARLYGGLEVETTLDPREQPFLFDHAIDGTPLLPGVMGVEAMAELATVLAPDHAVAAVEAVQFHNPCKFYRMEPVTLTLQAMTEPLADGALLAHTLLRTSRPPTRPGLPAQEKVHFTAHVRLSPSPPEAPAAEAPGLPGATDGVDAGAVYQTFFHGPAYQVLERVVPDATRAVGLLPAALPADSQPPGAPWLMAPRLVELIFQTAGVWKLENGGNMALPTALGHVAVYRPLTAADGRRLVALVEAVAGGDAFDGQVVDDAGHVYVRVHGYQTIDVPDQ